MGKKGCNKVGVTIKNLLNHDPTTTKTPAIKPDSIIMPPRRKGRPSRK